MKTWLIILVVCLLVYGMLVLYFYKNQEAMIFFGQGYGINRDNLRFANHKEVEFKADDATLRGWLVNPDADRLLVYYGGNAEELSETFPQFSQLDNWSVLLVNYRGFGDSTGKPSQDAIYRDALHILDEAQKEKQYTAVAVMGRSLGSGVATHVARHRDVDGIVLTTPYDSIRNVAKENYPWLPVDLMLRHPFDSDKDFAETGQPALILLSEFDRVVGRERSKALIAIRSEHLEVVELEQTSHNDIVAHPDYIPRVQAFLDSL